MQFDGLRHFWLKYEAGNPTSMLLAAWGELIKVIYEGKQCKQEVEQDPVDTQNTHTDTNNRCVCS